QRDDEDFDPEDMNYNTFRWVTTDRTFAMGPMRTNPLTGEILDADIIFDASFIRYWKRERQMTREGKAYVPVSPIQALDVGGGLAPPTPRRDAAAAGWNDRPLRPNPKADRLAACRQGVCQCPSHMRLELGLASLALGEAMVAPLPKEAIAKDKEKKAKERD